MARTSRPADTVLHTASLSAEAVAHIAAVVDAGLFSPSEAVNAELDFLRTWGLPEHFTRRVEAEAKRRGITTLELVNDILWDAAEALPRASVPKPPRSPPARPPRKQLVLAITGPNEAWLLRHSDVWKVDSYEALLERALEFARGYGLPPEAQAALQQHAKGQGDSVRELVRELLMEAADHLPEAPAEAPHPPAKRPHPRRSAAE